MREACALLSNEAMLSVLILVDPRIQISDIDEDATVGAHRRNLATSDHVLDRIFGATDVSGCLFNRQQARPHLAIHRSSLIAVLKAGGHLLCHAFYQGVKIEPFSRRSSEVAHAPLSVPFALLGSTRIRDRV